MMSESLRIPSKGEIMFSLFLPPKIASAVRLYGDVTIFDASASFLSLPDSGRLKKRRPKDENKPNLSVFRMFYVMEAVLKF